MHTERCHLLRPYPYFPYLSSLQMNPNHQPNRVWSHVSPGRWIVIPEVVVMESSLRIVVLARIYSDTSPPKKAVFYPLGFSFQRPNVKKLEPFASRAAPKMNFEGAILTSCLLGNRFFSPKNDSFLNGIDHQVNIFIPGLLALNTYGFIFWKTMQRLQFLIRQ